MRKGFIIMALPVLVSCKELLGSKICKGGLNRLGGVPARVSCVGAPIYMFEIILLLRWSRHRLAAMLRDMFWGVAESCWGVVNREIFLTAKQIFLRR